MRNLTTGFAEIEKKIRDGGDRVAVDFLIFSQRTFRQDNGGQDGDIRTGRWLCRMDAEYHKGNLLGFWANGGETKGRTSRQSDIRIGR